MYRDNEASRVGEVLACKLAGDTPGMIAAASRLWLLPVEQPGAHDAAAAEVWRAIEVVGAVAKAVEAGVLLLRARQLVRPAAFVELVEHIDDPAVLLELATLVTAAGWPSHPYLATVFLWLVELKQEVALWAHIQQHRDRLRADTQVWTLVGFILTTSRIGDRHDVDAWFHDWGTRPDVPMWIVAAYAASVAQLGDAQLPRLVAIARAAWTTATRDATTPLILAFLLIDDLRAGRHAEFLAGMREHAALVAPPATAARLAHPIVRYANAVKHRSPITTPDFEFSLAALNAAPHTASLTMLAVKGLPPRPVNWRTITLIQELDTRTATAARIMPLFLAMLEVPRGDARAVELYREMGRARPKELPWLQDPWKRLVKARLPWLTRLKLEYT